MYFLTSLRALLVVISLIYCSALQAAELRVALLVTSGEARTAYLKIGKLFEAETGISVVWVARDDATYKRALDPWLLGENTPDVLYWQAGERLLQFARNGLVEPITDLWNTNRLDEVFPAGTRAAVSEAGEVYGIPYSYYQWGFYYNKSLFKKVGATPPTSWSELLDWCDLMKDNGVAPFVVGTRNHWPAAAWFDYLNLRTNGLAFHLSLMRGDVSYTDSQVRQVFQHWKTLLDRGCFVDASIHRSWNWKETLPFIYRQIGGAGLYGNFVSSEFPDQMAGNIGFFPFPAIEDVPAAEEAPIELFMLPKRSANKVLGRKFLAFMARADVQGMLNADIRSIPTNTNAPIADDYFIQKGANLLHATAGVSQYFDRDTPREMADQALKIMTDFLVRPDIDQTLNALEDLRRNAY